MSVLASLRALKRDAAKPPIATVEMKHEKLFIAGYKLGYSHALEDAIELAEEEE